MHTKRDLNVISMIAESILEIIYTLNSVCVCILILKITLNLFLNLLTLLLYSCRAAYEMF